MTYRTKGVDTKYLTLNKGEEIKLISKMGHVFIMEDLRGTRFSAIEDEFYIQEEELDKDNTGKSTGPLSSEKPAEQIMIEKVAIKQKPAPAGFKYAAKKKAIAAKAPVQQSTNTLF